MSIQSTFLFILISMYGFAQSNKADQNQPLYIIDGKATSNVSNLNSRAIESVKVLKASEAIPLYGSSAAKGAILITTNDYKLNNVQTVICSFPSPIQNNVVKKPKPIFDNYIKYQSFGAKAIYALPADSIINVNFLKGRERPKLNIITRRIE